MAWRKGDGGYVRTLLYWAAESGSTDDIDTGGGEIEDFILAIIR